MSRTIIKTKNPSFEGKTLHEIQKLAGLDWTASKAQSRYYYKGEGMKTPQMRSHEGQYSVIRDDNGEPLGMVGEDYKILQPSYFFEAIGRLREHHDLELIDAKCLRGGSLISVQVKSREMMELKINDRDVTVPFLNLCTGFDGKTRTQASGFSFRAL